MVVGVLTASNILRMGLDIAHISRCEQRRLSKPTKYRKFKSHYGVHPLHAARAWRDLLTTTIPAARINETDKSIYAFFAALNLVRVYATEDIRDDFIGDHMHLNEMRNMAWDTVVRLGALKELKIVWPQPHEWTTTFSISVDGTHCLINEPRDPVLKKNKEWYSHKHHKAGLNYEIAVAMFESKIVHAKSGDPASTHDMTVFRMELKQKIPPGKCVVADKSYDARAESNILSTYNQFDTDAVKEFKRRARARHETINSKLKNFKCLDNKFRHGVVRAQQCFDCCIVLLQYAIEDTGPHGEPLFDV